MKPFIPSEEEFETLLTALGSYEKEQVTTFVVGQYLKKMEGITNEQAFVKAFSKEIDKEVEESALAQTKMIRDKVVLLFAKVIQFRDFVREHQTADAIEQLTKS